MFEVGLWNGNSPSCTNVLGLGTALISELPSGIASQRDSFPAG